jgi:hypothetical protein
VRVTAQVCVNKALELLRARPSIEIRHLWDPGPILQGDAQVSLELLGDILRSYTRKEYSHRDP